MPGYFLGGRMGSRRSSWSRRTSLTATVRFLASKSYWCKFSQTRDMLKGLESLEKHSKRGLHKTANRRTGLAKVPIRGCHRSSVCLGSGNGWVGGHQMMFLKTWQTVLCLYYFTLASLQCYKECSLSEKKGQVYKFLTRDILGNIEKFYSIN